MIESKGANATNCRAPDAVGGIETPANAHFQNHNIHILLKEYLQACKTDDGGVDHCRY